MELTGINMAKPRLQEEYVRSLRPALQKELDVKNIMQVPKINKIVLNVGVGRDAIANSKALQSVVDILGRIAGQRPVKTLARKSIAGFKIREGMQLGSKVTLRGKKMYEFLDRLISIALPAVRDFQGVSTKFDQNGNYNLGIKEWNIFPEVGYDAAEKVYGLNITIDTTAQNHEQAYALLKSFGMPFKKAQS